MSLLKRSRKVAALLLLSVCISLSPLFTQEAYASTELGITLPHAARLQGLAITSATVPSIILTENRGLTQQTFNVSLNGPSQIDSTYKDESELIGGPSLDYCTRQSFTLYRHGYKNFTQHTDVAFAVTEEYPCWPTEDYISVAGQGYEYITPINRPGYGDTIDFSTGSYYLSGVDSKSLGYCAFYTRALDADDYRYTPTYYNVAINANGSFVCTRYDTSRTVTPCALPSTLCSVHSWSGTGTRSGYSSMVDSQFPYIQSLSIEPDLSVKTPSVPGYTSPIVVVANGTNNDGTRYTNYYKIRTYLSEHPALVVSKADDYRGDAWHRAEVNMSSTSSLYKDVDVTYTDKVAGVYPNWSDYSIGRQVQTVLDPDITFTYNVYETTLTAQSQGQLESLTFQNCTFNSLPSWLTSNRESIENNSLMEVYSL